MRNQRRSSVKVVINSQRVTEDDLGNETPHPKKHTVPRCQFDPDHLQEGARDQERPDGDQVRVLRTGVLNIPGVFRLISDDTLDFLGSTWQVVGNGQVWRDRTKVRVQQVRAR